MPTVFNPRSPYGERHAGNGQRPAAANFNPRSPCGATTPPFSHSSYAVFQSTSPCGERLGRRVRREPRANFNPRPPCGERLLNFHIVLLQNLFQSTLPVWGATEVMTQYTGTEVISIHAPRVGSDGSSDPVHRHGRHFNPRSPCGERLLLRKTVKLDERFQSTLPVWGATTRYKFSRRYSFLFQSTLPVWGATTLRDYDIQNYIYKKTLTECGATPGYSVVWCQTRYFNPRSPCGERLGQPLWISDRLAISIHAPRVGSDTSCLTRSQPFV